MNDIIDGLEIVVPSLGIDEGPFLDCRIWFGGGRFVPLQCSYDLCALWRWHDAKSAEDLGSVECVNVKNPFFRQDHSTSELGNLLRSEAEELYIAQYN